MELWNYCCFRRLLPSLLSTFGTYLLGLGSGARRCPVPHLSWAAVFPADGRPVGRQPNLAGWLEDCLPQAFEAVPAAPSKVPRLSHRNSYLRSVTASLKQNYLPYCCKGQWIGSGKAHFRLLQRGPFYSFPDPS